MNVEYTVLELIHCHCDTNNSTDSSLKVFFLGPYPPKRYPGEANIGFPFQLFHDRLVLFNVELHYHDYVQRRVDPM